jgi:hypothetical protein
MRRHGRKERVLHTRISDRLADDIRRIADDLRLPVSNLVRNVLEEAFDAVESVSNDLGSVIEEVMDEAEGASLRIQRARERVRRRRERRRRGWSGERDSAEDAEAVPPPAAPGEPVGPPPPPVEWYFVEDGRRRGPADRDDMAELARAGRVARDTLVWCAGMSDWEPAGDVRALGILFAPPEPPAVPAT